MAVTQAKGPVQVRGEVFSVKQIGDYLAMTVVASGIAEQTRPGQFVAVVLRLSTRPNAIVVPSQVVQTGQAGSYVFVVKPDDTVEMRTVTKGTRIGPDVEVEQGLQPGEIVVSDGQLRLAPGMRVQVRK